MHITHYCTMYNYRRKLVISCQENVFMQQRYKGSVDGQQVLGLHTNALQPGDEGYSHIHLLTDIFDIKLPVQSYSYCTDVAFLCKHDRSMTGF